MLSLTAALFIQHAAACAPAAHHPTLVQIARQESALRPWALSINYPKGTAKALGRPGATARLQSQPESKAQAVQWARALIGQGYTVSMGLMQVSSQNLSAFGYSVEDAFEPCNNIKMGASIYNSARQQAVNADDPDAAALSIYNSGNATMGIANGYAQGVMAQPVERFAPEKRFTRAPLRGETETLKRALTAPTNIAWPIGR